MRQPRKSKPFMRRPKGRSRPAKCPFSICRAARIGVQAGQEARLDARALEGGQGLADFSHQLTGRPEIDRAEAAVLAVGQLVIGPEGLAVAVAVGGGDVALAAEDVGPGGDQLQGRVSELVSRLGIFQFHTTWASWGQRDGRRGPEAEHEQGLSGFGLGT